MQMIKGAKQRALSFMGYENGTYDPFTRESKEYNIGFQATFVRPNTFIMMSDDEYDEKVFELMVKTESDEHVGVFENKPETSFYLISRQEATKIAEQYNQKSIWDWKRGKEIKNRNHDKFIND